MHARHWTATHIDLVSSRALLVSSYVSDETTGVLQDPLSGPELTGHWPIPEPTVWLVADRRRDCGRWLAVRADKVAFRSCNCPILGRTDRTPRQKSVQSALHPARMRLTFLVWNLVVGFELARTGVSAPVLVAFMELFGASAPRVRPPGLVRQRRAALSCGVPHTPQGQCE